MAARRLMVRFLSLADALQAMDVDRHTLGEAANLADAERMVLDAITRHTLAKAAVAGAAAALHRAETALSRAESAQAAAKGHGAQAEASAARSTAAAARAVTTAQADLDAAVSRAALAAAALADALIYAADCATRLRQGLARRHGGIAQAAEATPVRMADRRFYQ